MGHAGLGSVTADSRHVITGPHTCVGNNLALNTIRLVVARLVTKYTFRLAEGVSPQAFDDGAQDHFATLPGNLYAQVGVLQA